MRTILAAVLAATTGCAALRAEAPSVAPLRDEGEVVVLLQPLPRDAARLSLLVAGVSLRRQDGSEVPLQVARRTIEDVPGGDQHPFASGRVPPGDYAGLEVRIESAAVLRPDGPARLLVPEEPSRAELALHVGGGRALVVWLRLGEQPVQPDFGLAPRFIASLPMPTPPGVGLYCTNASSASVTVADRGTRLVTAVLPVAGEPRGIALDPPSARAYVALPREDQIEVIDLTAGATVTRIRLAPGDGPAELAVAQGKLLVVNERSRTLAFLDLASLSVVARVPVGDAPVALVLDRNGRRAYVVNRASATVTVVDVANQAVVATLATEPEPLRVQLNRDGTRLFVVQRGSMYLSAFALPSLAPVARGFVGLGAATLKVDARTDLVYLAWEGEESLTVVEPIGLQVIDRFPLPGPASYLAIDDVADALLAVVPTRRTVAVVDLTSRRVLAELPVGARPHEVTAAAERP